MCFFFLLLKNSYATRNWLSLSAISIPSSNTPQNVSPGFPFPFSCSVSLSVLINPPVCRRCSLSCRKRLRQSPIFISPKYTLNCLFMKITTQLLTSQIMCIEDIFPQAFSHKSLIVCLWVFSPILFGSC